MTAPVSITADPRPPAPRARRPPGWEGILFAVVGALTFHALYGSLGFNPTDEGFLLAQSRRLLDGAIPHLDFLSPRPVGSPLLHAHLLLWAGERIFWWGRAVAALEVMATAWLWAALIAGAGIGLTNRGVRLALATAAAAVAVHTFPVMPWHTVDGIFLVLWGLWLARTSLTTWRDDPARALLGCFVAGYAVLCRQNLAPAVLLVPLVAGRWRDPRAWIALALPGLIYAAALALGGALPEAIRQVTANTGSLLGVATIGLRLDPPWPIVGVFTGLGAAILAVLGRPVTRISAAAFLMMPLVGAAWQSASSSPWGIPIQGWLAWGGLLGFLPALLARGPALRAALPLSLFALLLGSTSAISLGHAAPSLAGGGAWLLLAAFGERLLPPVTSDRQARLRLLALVAFLIALGARFHDGRTSLVYMDRSARELTRDAGTALPGASGLLTCDTTWAMLTAWRANAAELDRLSGSARWAVVPDLAATWVLSSRANPLPADWLYPVELSSPGARERVGAALLGPGGPDAVILQRYDAASLPWRLQPADTSALPALAIVTSTWDLARDDDWFRVYARPGSTLAASLAGARAAASTVSKTDGAY